VPHFPPAPHLYESEREPEAQSAPRAEPGAERDTELEAIEPAAPAPAPESEAVEPPPPSPPEPEPEPEAVDPWAPEPAPESESVEPSPPPSVRVVPKPPPPEPEAKSRPEPDPAVDPSAPRRRAGGWNLWDLERLAQDEGQRQPARAGAWSALLLLLREHASPDGSLPPEFDALVRDSFGDLLEHPRP
jgi:hypothetical protein